MIPNKSEASVKNGNWFIYQDGGNLIQIWGSNVTGKEKVYLNNELVSERTSIKMQSEHQFTDQQGQNYEVKFEMESLLKGRLKCVIKRDETILRSFRVDYGKGKNFSLTQFSLLILGSAIIGFLIGTFDFSNLTLFLFIGTLIFFYFATRKKGEIEIVEE
jgi:Ca2+-dependent lipid-binding protein